MILQPYSPTALQPYSPTALFALKFYPRISNTKDFERVGSHSVTATWSIPQESIYKIWIRILVGNFVSNQTYSDFYFIKASPPFIAKAFKIKCQI